VNLKASNDAGESNSSTKSINVEAKKTPPTDTEKLVAGPWKMISHTSTPETTGLVRDNYQFWDSCEKDDVLVFKVNNTYHWEEGKTPCKSGDPTIIPGSQGVWQFTSSGVLTIDGTEAEILETLTDKSVKIKYTEKDGSGSKTIVKIGLIRQ
jgi:hypothetical protein